MAFPSDLTRTKNWGTEVLTDGDLEGQFDLIINWVMAFANATTGHDHSGSNKGAPVVLSTSGQGVTGTLPATNGGTGIATYTQGDVLYSSAANTLAKLAAGTSGLVLKTQGAGANPTWASSVGSVLHYGTSASTSTAYTGTELKVCFGKIDLTSLATQAITNLPFTSASTYSVIAGFTLGGSLNHPGIVNDSGAQFTITNNVSSTKTYTWIAIGV